jgi:hypothetical protein
MKNTVTGAKLTATEARAQSDMESALKYGSHYFRIYWTKSRMWGYNPTIPTSGGSAVNISGCGYCKESAALANYLRFLGATEEEQFSVWGRAGAGFGSIAEALALIGWKLDKTYSGKTEDAYQLTRMEVAV